MHEVRARPETDVERLRVDNLQAYRARLPLRVVVHHFGLGWAMYVVVRIQIGATRLSQASYGTAIVYDLLVMLSRELCIVE